MAKNVEIEIKSALKNAPAVIAMLDRDAPRVLEAYQKDVYYTPAHRDFLEEPENITEWLRVRTTTKGASVNYKNWLPKDAPIKTHCQEFETAIEDAEQLDLILQALDMRELVTVEKQRTSWNINGIEVSIDEVKGLGYFIELEAKELAGTVEAVREQLFDYLKILGVDFTETDTKGYPFHLLKQKGYFEEMPR